MYLFYHDHQNKMYMVLLSREILHLVLLFGYIIIWFYCYIPTGTSFRAKGIYPTLCYVGRPGGGKINIQYVIQNMTHNQCLLIFVPS